jgi:hypothetical protein
VAEEIDRQQQQQQDVDDEAAADALDDEDDADGEQRHGDSHDDNDDARDDGSNDDSDDESDDEDDDEDDPQHGFAVGGMPMIAAAAAAGAGGAAGPAAAPGIVHKAGERWSSAKTSIVQQTEQTRTKSGVFLPMLLLHIIVFCACYIACVMCVCEVRDQGGCTWDADSCPRFVVSLLLLLLLLQLVAGCVMV